MEKKEYKNICSVTYLEKFEISDLDERRLFINMGIDEEIIDSTVYHILRYNRLDKGLKPEERKPIFLYINSPGGSVCDGYGLIDVIQSSITPVYTINQALCASMGFLIFLAGHKRYSMQRSEFLMHDGSTAGWDSTAKMKDRMDFETNQLEQMTKNYIMSRTTIDNDLYDAKYRVEWYMLPQEAKKHGIIDYIVGIDCTLDEII
jgi:ATP-dependent Clp protease protease subunit